MQSRIANFCTELDMLKDSFAEYIKDQSIPLEVRWDTWKNSPICLKEQKEYYYTMHLGAEDITDCLYDDGYERHQTIDTLEFLDRIVENKYCALTEETPKEDYPNQETWQPEGMDVLKEKILADNMGSFIYDW